MRVLITGANGFIGAHLAAGMFGAGHGITACARDPNAARRQFPLYDWIRIDLNRDTDPSIWMPRLEGVDAVVNCAGILQGAAGQSLDAVHRDGPAALFDACAAAGVRRVIQISALGNDPGAGTHYADSKRAADEYLKALDLDWVILRPSLVYTAGVYGGTATLRGLAGFPFVVPLAGGGHQPFQPIHMDDLALAVRKLAEPGAPANVELDAVGPAPMPVRDIVLGIRAWLGFGRARVLAIPMPVLRIVAWAGDVLGWFSDRGTLRTTAIRQLEHGNTGDGAPFFKAIGYTPRSFAHGLATEPSHVQDRWHARLVFLAPVLRIALALLAIGAAVFIGLDNLPILDITALPAYLDQLLDQNRIELVLQYVGSILFGYIVPFLAIPILFGWRVKFFLAAVFALSFLALILSGRYSLFAYGRVDVYYGYPAWAFVFALMSLLALVCLALVPRR